MSLENEFHRAMIGVADFANSHGFGNRILQMSSAQFFCAHQRPFTRKPALRVSVHFIAGG
jgi:hypothetical protein